MRLITILLPLTLILPACGGDALDPGAGDDPGTGTSTLAVDGDVEASPQIDNAQVGSDLDTSFHVRVTRAGQAVTTGEVSVTSRAGTTALVFDPSDEDGRWRGTQSGYFEVYELDVVAGDDAVEGVRVDGPDLHRFVAPLAGATVEASLPLPVEWDCGDVADSATIETREGDGIGIADTGSYQLPVGMLRSNDAETEHEQIELRRASRIAPAGAVGGSELRVSVRNRIDLVVAPCPTCVN